MILGRNVKFIISISLKVLVFFVSYFFIIDSMRISVIKLRFFSVRSRERMRNVCFYFRDNYFCDVLSIYRGVFILEVIIILWEIGKVYF